MSLITIHGINPFDGQADPYLSLSSQISYEGGVGEVLNSYTLDGVITGCDKNTLINLQTGIVDKFDWERDPTIPQNIKISGVIEASAQSQIVPNSLSFENSNYIGAISYTLSLDVYTGRDINSEQDDLIEKVHTETTNIDEKECVSISTSISCQPNQNLTGCGAIEAANKWISGQLGQTKLGEITRTKNLPLANESLTINPLTSSISYTSSHGGDCGDTTEAGAPHTGFKLAYCSESSLKDNNCISGNVINQYNGEVYRSGASETQLIEYLNNNLLTGFPNKNKFSANYQSSQDSITFSFETMSNSGGLVYEPRDLIIDDYTTSIEIDHNDNSTSYSVNGNIFILNKTSDHNNTILSMSNQEILSRAKTNIDGEGSLISLSINRQDQEGTISYSARFGDGNGNDDKEVERISSSSVSVNPPLYNYSVKYTMCDYAISKSLCPSRGSVSASVTSPSGSGYNYFYVANYEALRLIRAFGGQTEEDNGVDYTDDKSSVTVSKTYSYKGNALN